MTRRQQTVDHLEWWSMRRVFAVSVAAALFLALFATAAVADEHEKFTGLERAAQATMHGLEKSQGKAAEAPGQVNRAKGLDKDGEKLTGHERAAAAIAAALAPGNGNGNAFGRGHAAEVLGILLGEIPGELNELNHGQTVREMVHAYNELRKADDGG
jgi:hypothetical protein